MLLGNQNVCDTCWLNQELVAEWGFQNFGIPRASVDLGIMGFKAPRGSMAFGPGAWFFDSGEGLLHAATQCAGGHTMSERLPDGREGPRSRSSRSLDVSRGRQAELHGEFELRLCQSHQECTGRIYSTAAALRVSHYVNTD